MTKVMLVLEDHEHDGVEGVVIGIEGWDVESTDPYSPAETLALRLYALATQLPGMGKVTILDEED